MKFWLRYLGVLLIAYSVFLIATLPATHAYAWAGHALLPLKLYQIEGSVWSGRAEVADIGSYRLGSLSWDSHPFMLLLGRTEFAWEAVKDGNTARGVLARTLLGGALNFKSVSANLPVTEIGASLSVLPIQPAGILQIRLNDTKLSGSSLLEAHGALTWHDASLVKPQAISLGNFVLNLDTVDSGVKGTLLDKGGPIEAQGILLLKPDGSYQFDGTLATRDPSQTQIHNALGFIGTPTADGKFAVTYSGTLTGAKSVIKTARTAGP